jgi:hypothetical protein
MQLGGVPHAQSTLPHQTQRLERIWISTSRTRTGSPLLGTCPKDGIRWALRDSNPRPQPCESVLGAFCHLVTKEKPVQRPFEGFAVRRCYALFLRSFAQVTRTLGPLSKSHHEVTVQPTTLRLPEELANGPLQTHSTPQLIQFLAELNE